MPISYSAGALRRRGNAVLWPEATRRREFHYEAPEGLILHTAGQGDRGWYGGHGDVQPPPEAAPQFYDVQVVVIPC